MFLNENLYHLGNLTFSVFFKVCIYFNHQFFKFSWISSSQSEEIFHVVVTLILVLALTELKSPNGLKTEDIKLSKPLFDGENDFIAAFTLIVLLSEFYSIPKALSNGILSKSRLTDWQFADKPSWGKYFKIFLSFDTNFVKWNPTFFKISNISLHIFIASV